MADLIIHEIYAAGSTPGGQQSGVPTYQYDYVVLHNTTGTAIDLSGFALQTINGTGTGNWSVLDLTGGSISAYGYYLIQLGTTASTLGGAALPVTADATAGDAMALGPNSAKLAITNTTTALTGAISTGASIVDMVGFGTQANAREGSSSANNAPSPTNTTAITRDAAGGFDTNVNSADFVSSTPNPRNTSSDRFNITSTAAASFAENATGTVLDVNAFDPEGQTENGGGLTYSIVTNTGDDSGLFTIDSATGALAFLTPPNFEAGTGHGSNPNEYVLTVRLNDNGAPGRQVDQAITITVTDVNEFAVSAPVDSNAALNARDENSTGQMGLTASASDADGSNNTITYSLVTDLTGATAYTGPFAINSASGIVSLSSPLDYETAGSAFNLFVKASSSDGSSAVSQFTLNIDNVSPETQTGTSGNNRLNGGSDRDILRGLSGNDFLNGFANKDVLVGGTGRDIMTGGTGPDTFDFNARAETGKTSATRDRITDFTHLFDKIDLKDIDANSSASGNQAFTFLSAKGAAFTGVKGQLHWFQINYSNNALDKTIIEGDVNGDKVADFQIELTGLKTLTKADFVL